MAPRLTSCLSKPFRRWDGVVQSVSRTTRKLGRTGGFAVGQHSALNVAEASLNGLGVGEGIGCRPQQFCGFTEGVLEAALSVGIAGLGRRLGGCDGELVVGVIQGLGELRGQLARKRLIRRQLV